MSELTTKRTLVKSPPELWAEVSDLEALAKHLGEFGEIKITRLEPETTVVWEGERVSGTVRLEPSGWGTKVTLTAELAEVLVAEEPSEPEPPPEPVAVEAPPPSPIQETPEPEPAAAELIEPEPEPVVEKVGFWARLVGRRKPVAAEVPPAEPPPPETPPPPVEEPEEPPPVEEPPAPEPPPLQPVPDPEPPPAPEPDDPLPAAELDDDRAVAVLTGVLDNLGSAHHRPFSRG
jgi:hypothetical protein